MNKFFALGTVLFAKRTVPNQKFCIKSLEQAYIKIGQSPKHERRDKIMWHTKNTDEIERKLNTNIQKGLTNKEAQKRQEEQGKNKLKEKKKESIIIRFIKQFNDFMIIVLIIAAIISAIVAKTNGSGDYIDSIIIIAIVIFNAIMGLIQEEKAEKSLEALKKMSAPNAKVRRNGKIKSSTRRYCNARSRKLCSSRL